MHRLSWRLVQEMGAGQDPLSPITPDESAVGSMKIRLFATPQSRRPDPAPRRNRSTHRQAASATGPPSH
jgi:hypothetical protein